MKYVMDGMHVIAHVQGHGNLLCKVLCAAGDMARIGCEDPKVDKWERVDNLSDPALYAQIVARQIHEE